MSVGDQPQPYCAILSSRNKGASRGMPSCPRDVVDLSLENDLFRLYSVYLYLEDETELVLRNCIESKTAEH